MLPPLPIKASARLFLCLLAVELLGCDQPFSPRAPFEQKLVIFSVLATNRNEQFVRVSTNYDVSGFDPNENTTDPGLKEATVSILSEGKTYTLRDTVLPRTDSERYKTPIICFAAKPFTVRYGKTYELQVASPTLGTARASLIVPEQSYLQIDGKVYLDKPPPLPPPPTPDFAITVGGNFSRWAAGYVLRFFLKYEVLKDTIWVAEELEVPMDLMEDSKGGILQVRYPAVNRVQGVRYAVSFVLGGYRWALRDIVTRYFPNRVVFKQASFRMTQLDENLYKYYKTVNGFEDKGSIRLDQPDFSNINGAVGMFGACAVDSLIYTLPLDFAYNR